MKRSPLSFFLWVFALSAPFWLLAAMTDRQLMPGLSVSALMTFCPLMAALILVHREDGAAGVTRLLRRSFDFKRIASVRWFAPILLVMPGVSLVVYGLMLWMGLPVPAPQFSWLAALLMFFAFFIAALGEELGWSGYALDPLQDRWTAMTASVVLGAVGILWHIVPLLLLHRPPAWIAWWCLYAMAARVVMVWLFNHTGKSVFAVALFHATLNLSYMLFPVSGSHFDMRLGGVVMAFAAAALVVLWGPQAFARSRAAEPGAGPEPSKP